MYERHVKRIYRVIRLRAGAESCAHNLVLARKKYWECKELIHLKICGFTSLHLDTITEINRSKNTEKKSFIDTTRILVEMWSNFDCSNQKI